MIRIGIETSGQFSSDNILAIYCLRSHLFDSVSLDNETNAMRQSEKILSELDSYSIRIQIMKGLTTEAILYRVISLFIASFATRNKILKNMSALMEI